LEYNTTPDKNVKNYELKLTEIWYHMAWPNKEIKEERTIDMQKVPEKLLRLPLKIGAGGG
jgi:hypothetical protein